MPRDQMVLIPTTLDDLISEDNPMRLFDEILDQLRGHGDLRWGREGVSLAALSTLPRSLTALAPLAEARSASATLALPVSCWLHTGSVRCAHSASATLPVQTLEELSEAVSVRFHTAVQQQASILMEQIDRQLLGVLVDSKVQHRRALLCAEVLKRKQTLLHRETPLSPNQAAIQGGTG